jgi:hypothetical protein
MDWFYALNGQQNGPVSDAHLDQLLGSGTINQNTLVWRDGMANWQPLQLARTAGAAPPVLNPTERTPCVECHRTFPQSEMVFLNHSWVCAHCKPIFLQRLAEGAAPTSGTGMWRFKRQLVMRADTALPDSCVRCTAPANGYKLKRQLSWHPPAYFLLVLISPLIYIIVAMCIRKKAIVHVGLCDAHRAQRKWFIVGSWISVLLGIGLIGGAIGAESGMMGLAGAVLLLAGIIAGSVKAPVVSAAKIENGWLWVNGTGQSFLSNLPEWVGPR